MAAPDNNTHRSLAVTLVYLCFAGVLVVAAFLGTSVYNYYIPEIAVPKNFNLGLIVIPLVGGVAAFLSPCAFGMLPAYLGAILALKGRTVEGKDNGAAFVMSLRFGAATAAGMLFVGTALAVMIVTAGASFAPSLRVVTSEPNPFTRTVRLAAGVALILLGLAQIRRLSPEFLFRIRRRLPPLDPARQPLAWFFLYGMSYLAVALPCVANVLAAPLLYSWATEGFSSAALTAALFLATMAVMTMLVSVLVGLSKDALVRRLAAAGPHISSVAGFIFVAVGVTLVYLSLNLAAFRRAFFHFPIR